MSTKTLFKLLKNVFDWLWNINLVLGIGAIILVSANAFFYKKAISTAYLGSFKANTDMVGTISSDLGNSNVFIHNITGTPSLLIDSKMNIAFVYAYMLFVLSIVLFFNYQLKMLFATLNLNITEGTPFGNGISKCFTSLAKFSLLLCLLGSVLSLLKVWFINSITFKGLNFTPVFDNNILNLIWIGIACYIVAGIFKTGCQLKQENDLTI